MKKVGRNAVVPGGVEFRPSQNAREVPSTQVGAQRTDANPGHRAAGLEAAIADAAVNFAVMRESKGQASWGRCC